MNIKFKQTSALKKGVKQGIEKRIFDLKSLNPYYKKYEYTAFDYGYKIGIKTEEIEEMKIIKEAIKNDLINPINWKLFEDFNGNIYFEEL